MQITNMAQSAYLTSITVYFWFGPSASSSSAISNSVGSSKCTGEVTQGRASQIITDKWFQAFLKSTQNQN